MGSPGRGDDDEADAEDELADGAAAGRRTQRIRSGGQPGSDWICQDAGRRSTRAQRTPGTQPGEPPRSMRRGWQGLRAAQSGAARAEVSMFQSMFREGKPASGAAGGGWGWRTTGLVEERGGVEEWRSAPRARSRDMAMWVIRGWKYYDACLHGGAPGRLPL